MSGTIQEALRTLRNDYRKLFESENSFEVDVDPIERYKDALKARNSFKTLGISNILDSDDLEIFNKVKAEIDSYQGKIKDIDNSLEELKNYTPTPIIFTTAKGETYSRKKLALDYELENSNIDPEHLAEIFKGITFYNSNRRFCKITETDFNRYKFSKSTSKMYLTLVFNYGTTVEKPTPMTLDRFLYLVEIGDFSINGGDFVKDVKELLKPYSDAVGFESKIKELENDKKQSVRELKKIKKSDEYLFFKDLYNEVKKAVMKSYSVAAASIATTREVAPDVPEETDQEKIDKMREKAGDAKNVWNTTLGPEEKAEFIGWLCKHIRLLRIKVVERGNSEYITSLAYPDIIYGKKYREKANTSGWDASSGTIRFDNISGAPECVVNTFTKIVPEFNGRSTVLSSLSLVLFILGEYNEYGFKTEIPDLHKKINVEKLKKEKFGSFEQSFMKGYES